MRDKSATAGTTGWLIALGTKHGRGVRNETNDSGDGNGVASDGCSHDKVMKSLPGDAFTVTDYYRQNFYDPSDKKIGDIKDVLIVKAGQIKALMISVGGLLGSR
jgi:PRC-barrel domain protein